MLHIMLTFRIQTNSEPRPATVVPQILQVVWLQHFPLFEYVSESVTLAPKFTGHIVDKSQISRKATDSASSFA